jgi:hypothetical protein
MKALVLEVKGIVTTNLFYIVNVNTVEIYIPAYPQADIL